MFSAMAIAKAGAKNPSNNVLSRFFDAIELFMNSVGDLSAVFHNYGGSDYCAGINFGYYGAYFLTSFVSTVNAVKDLQSVADHIPEAMKGKNPFEENNKKR